jgi:AAA15 family ATPase/GTPase
MLTSLHIKNFKTLQDFNISTLNQINLFGGKNNIGKTTILEGLFMFYDRLNPMLIMLQFNRRGITSFNLSSAESLWGPLFHKYKLDNKISIEVKRSNGFKETLAMDIVEGNFDRKINLTNNLLSDSPKNNTDTSNMGKLELKLHYKNDKGSEESTLIVEGDQMQMQSNSRHNNRNLLSAVYLSSKNHNNPGEEAERFGQLEIYGESEKIKDFLKIVEPRLLSLTTISSGGGAMLHADIGMGRKIPIYHMGDGFVRLVSILLAIATSKDGFVIIDEFENGLHYSIMPAIWESISRASKEYNCQLFISTHSYECLQAASEGVRSAEMMNDFSYHRIFQDNEKLVKSKSINHSTLETALDSNMEVR